MIILHGSLEHYLLRLSAREGAIVIVVNAYHSDRGSKVAVKIEQQGGRAEDITVAAI